MSVSVCLDLIGCVAQPQVSHIAKFLLEYMLILLLEQMMDLRVVLIKPFMRCLREGPRIYVTKVNIVGRREVQSASSFILVIGVHSKLSFSVTASDYITVLLFSFLMLKRLGDFKPCYAVCGEFGCYVWRCIYINMCICLCVWLSLSRFSYHVYVYLQRNT